ncbi:hypothetical protein COY90_03625 [Candidatus Roizmanbacteria bacterium CG_4_10_14_0_8_um_filter_39_9]|uniref:Uncharacterized protein n=1 Tax=Candidatus Roizmanbacteria bacterium CG_4_10_14_0_8_um_filter_39_9 TaxID=1974829 RepID=A0A2M7QCA2_9BACT|nr:MAG: hypothetical protein COY90_03625 [Candidatus Roizmanbacteria bacterium CG_4_10_14_0_8_um_filter_39_9]
MATMEALNRDSYTKAMSTALYSKCEFNPIAGPYASLVERFQPYQTLWRPIAPTFFFTNCQAKTVNNEVQNIYLSTSQDGLKGGIVVEGENRKANIHVSQRLIKDKEVSTTVLIQDNDKENHGNLLLSHMYVKHQGNEKAIFVNIAMYSMTQIEKKKNFDFCTLTSSPNEWTLLWDFEGKKWNVVDNNGQAQALTDGQVANLQNQGFNLPTVVEKTEAGGIKALVLISGKEVEITIPTDLPKTDVMAAFLDGTPIVPFSIKVDDEEKVIDTSREQIEVWHGQLKRVEMTNTEFIGLSQAGSGSGRVLQKDLSLLGIFADYRVTGIEDGANYKVHSIIQEMVRNGVANHEVHELGINVAMGYNTGAYTKNGDGEGEFDSTVVVQSNKGYQFKLTSLMGKDDSNFTHNLRMRFSKEQVDQLKKDNTIAERYFDDCGDSGKPDPVLDWSHEKRKFVLRKYKDFELTQLENEIDCSAEDLKSVFGFEIAPEEIRLAGPVAHLGIKTGKREYSITVPSSLDGFNPTDEIKAKGPMLPLSIYTNAEGGWENIIK